MDLFKSKKFQSAIVAVIVIAGAKAGLDLDTELLLAIASPLIAYILGQGIADHGKEAAKIEAATNGHPDAG